MSAPRGFVLTLGHGPTAPGGLCDLTLRLARVATELGFAKVRVLQSRVPGSPSRYLYAVDPVGRCWKLRLSNHRRPADTRTPNLDLVSLDGRSGFDEAASFLRRAWRGEVGWFDWEATGRRPCTKDHRRWRRR